MADTNDLKEEKDSEALQNEEDQLCEEQDDILGDSDRYKCTYEKGYISRQAVYSCLTCATDNTPAFVCIACCIDCHNGHEILELYTKRNLRCDCGNSKFPDNKCQHAKDKDVSNLGNDYNHNYQGNYCICDRPYPDPDNKNECGMLQCIVCEDWYHENHLDVDCCPEGSSELICKSCTTTHSFLHDYAHLYEIASVEVEDSTSTEDQPSKKLKLSESKDDVATKFNGILGCKRNKKPVNPSSEIKSLFFSIGWRSKLCTCDNCMTMYKDNHIPFITDDGDSLTSYENRGRLSREIEPLDELTEGMDRFTKGEVMTGVNDMICTIRDIISDSKDKEVTKEQVEEAFKKLNKKHDDRVSKYK